MINSGWCTSFPPKKVVQGVLGQFLDADFENYNDYGWKSISWSETVIIAVDNQIELIQIEQYKLNITRWSIETSKISCFPWKFQSGTEKDRWIRIWNQILVNLKGTGWIFVFCDVIIISKVYMIFHRVRRLPWDECRGIPRQLVTGFPFLVW